jgi:hypothetical protein
MSESKVFYANSILLLYYNVLLLQSSLSPRAAQASCPLLRQDLLRHMADEPAVHLKQAPGVDVIEARCSGCHSLAGYGISPVAARKGVQHRLDPVRRELEHHASFDAPPFCVVP